MRALGPVAAFRESVAMFRQRPWTSLALGLALLTSQGAVCCGLGLVAGPWFLCELFVFQIGLRRAAPPTRRGSFLWAGAVQMLAILVLCSLMGLALVAVGPDLVLGGALGQSPVSRSPLVLSLGALLAAGGLALLLSVPFEHAPAILIDRGGGLIAALLESTRLVSASGFFRTWITSVCAHGLQLAPVVLAIGIAATRGTLASTALWGVVLLPVLALCIVLGQGMVVASYLSLESEVTDPERVPLEARPSTSGAVVWSLLLLGVTTGPVLVAGSLVKPSLLRPGQLPYPSEIVLEQAPREKAQDRYLADTALSVRVLPRSVRITASDGGGVGKLPLPPDARVTNVRAARIRELPPELLGPGAGVAVYALEITLVRGPALLTWVDETGVRLDDTAAQRLAALLPLWAVLALFACLFWTSLWVARALPKQAELRRKLSEVPCPGAAQEPPGRIHAALRRRALVAALWLLPASACSLAIGLWAALA